MTKQRTIVTDRAWVLSIVVDSSSVTIRADWAADAAGRVYGALPWVVSSNLTGDRFYCLVWTEVTGWTHSYNRIVFNAIVASGTRSAIRDICCTCDSRVKSFGTSSWEQSSCVAVVSLGTKLRRISESSCSKIAEVARITGVLNHTVIAVHAVWTVEAVFEARHHFKG